MNHRKHEFSTLYVKFTRKVMKPGKFVTSNIRVLTIRKHESVSNKDSKYDETVACSMFLGFYICSSVSLA